MSKKKEKDSDLPETQPEGLSPEGDEAFQPDETTMVPFDQFHDVLLKLEESNARATDLAIKNADCAGKALEYENRIKELEKALLEEKGFRVSLFDPDQVETHHLNPSELPAWVLAKLPESLTVDTSKFQEPPVAYAIRFALGRGAKEGDIVHFCAGV